MYNNKLFEETKKQNENKILYYSRGGYGFTYGYDINNKIIYGKEEKSGLEWVDIYFSSYTFYQICNSAEFFPFIFNITKQRSIGPDEIKNAYKI